MSVRGPDGWLYPDGTTFSDVPLRPAEIASDANLSLAALDNQLRAEQDEADDFTMTAQKLAQRMTERPAGFGHATLHLPPGTAEMYDLLGFSEEDALLVMREQARLRGEVMRQQIMQTHRLDDNGNPAGGSTSGKGISIQWQDGPLQDSEGGTRKEPNGAFVEGVIAAAAGRLEHYQSTQFACAENEEALAYLDLALEALDRRTRDREARGVEGTHEV